MGAEGEGERKENQTRVYRFRILTKNEVACENLIKGLLLYSLYTLVLRQFPGASFERFKNWT